MTDGTACADADMCNGAETCQAGACTPAAAPLDCDDGDACTTDSCDAANGCQHAAVPNCGTGGAGGASSSSSSSSSSSGSSSSSSGADGGTGGSGTAEPGDDGGCGCRVGAAPPSWAGLSFASLLALVAGLRRRRRDEGSPTR